MPRAKFSIGIDLGTTNCAMAFEPLGGAETRTQVFAIPQWEKPGALSEHATLPSFLYLPAAHEAAALGGEAGWVPGRFARKQAARRYCRRIAEAWTGEMRSRGAHFAGPGLGDSPAISPRRLLPRKTPRHPARFAAERGRLVRRRQIEERGQRRVL